MSTRCSTNAARIATNAGPAETSDTITAAITNPSTVDTYVDDDSIDFQVKTCLGYGLLYTTNRDIIM